MNYSSLKKNLVIKFSNAGYRSQNGDGKGAIGSAARRRTIEELSGGSGQRGAVHRWGVANDEVEETAGGAKKKKKIDVLLEIDDILKGHVPVREEDFAGSRKKGAHHKSGKLGAAGQAQAALPKGSIQASSLSSSLATTSPSAHTLAGSAPPQGGVANGSVLTPLGAKCEKREKKIPISEQEGAFKKKLDIVEASFSVVDKWSTHIELIDFVRNNMKNKEFIYVRSLPGGGYEKAPCGCKKEEGVLSISLSGVMTNEKNETTFYELNEWKDHITLLNSALSLNFVRKFPLYKYFFLLKNVIKSSKFKRKKKYIKENLLFLNQHFLRGFVEIQTILDEIIEYRLVDTNINNMSLDQFRDFQAEYSPKFDSFIKGKLNHIATVICQYSSKALKGFLEKNGIVQGDSAREGDGPIMAVRSGVAQRGRTTTGADKGANKEADAIANANVHANGNAGTDVPIDVYYNKIALSSCYCVYIKRFIQLCQYLCDNALRGIILYTYEYFLGLLNNYFEEDKNGEDTTQGKEIGVDKNSRVNGDMCTPCSGMKGLANGGAALMRQASGAIYSPYAQNGEPGGSCRANETAVASVRGRNSPGKLRDKDGTPYRLIKVENKESNVKSDSANVGVNINTMYSKSNSARNKTKNEVCLFSVVLHVEKDHLRITPECNLLINTLMHCFYVGIENICMREEFFNYYKVREFFSSEIFVDSVIFRGGSGGKPSATQPDGTLPHRVLPHRVLPPQAEPTLALPLQGLPLSSFANSISADETIQQLDEELKEKMKIMYCSMVQSCSEFEEVIKLHNKNDQIEVNQMDIMNTQSISQLFTSFKELEHKIKRMDKQIQIHLFKVDNSLLIDNLLSSIRTKWNHLISYLPSLSNQTIEELTTKLDKSFNLINTIPSSIGDLVEYITFTNKFAGELVSIEENVESISSLFLLFKKYYISISGNYTTKIFHINQKMNAMKSILHKEKNYDIEFSTLFRELTLEIGRVEHNIQSILNIVKGNLVQFNCVVSLEEMECLLHCVTPIGDIQEEYYSRGGTGKGANSDGGHDHRDPREGDDSPFQISPDDEIQVLNEETRNRCYIFELLEFLRKKILDVKKDVDKYLHYQKVLKKKKNAFVNFSLLKNMFLNNSLAIYTYYKYLCCNEKHRREKIFRLDVASVSSEIGAIDSYFKRVNKNFVNGDFYERCNRFHMTYESALRVLRLLGLVRDSREYFERAVAVLNGAKGGAAPEDVAWLNRDGLNPDGLNRDGLNRDDLNRDDLNRDDLNRDDLNRDDLNRDDSNLAQLNRSSASHPRPAAIPIAQEQIELRHLLHLHIANSIPDLENICFEYEKEKKMNEQLERLKAGLKKNKIDVTLVNKKVYFVNNLAELMHNLKGTLAELFVLENDSFSRHVYPELYNLSTQIRNFTNILGVIQKIQPCYLQLAKHKNSELKKALKTDHLSSIVAKYKQMCEDFFIYPQLMKHLEKAYQLEEFEKTETELRAIQQEVEKHTLQRRSEWYTFFLLTDEEFLDVYLNMNELKCLNRYVHKLFPYVKKFIFQNESICGIISSDKERVLFREEIKYKKTEFLLNEINKEISNVVMRSIHGYAARKEFLAPLKEDSYLFFWQINNLQQLFILINVYFTHIWEGIIHDPQKSKYVIYLITENLRWMVREAQQRRSRELGQANHGQPLQRNKGWAMIFTFFAQMRDQLQAFLNEQRNGAPTGNSTYSYLEQVKHHLDKETYRIRFFHHSVKYRYELLGNQNYTMDMIYHQKSYGFFFYKYVQNGFILLPSRSIYGMSHSKNFSTLLGFHYILINNKGLQESDLLNYISCSLCSNVSVFLHQVDSYRPEVLAVLNEQLANIRNHLVNKMKSIKINGSEFNLSKKNLMYISLSNESLPFGEYYSEGGSLDAVSTLHFSLSVHEPAKPFSLTVLFLVFLSCGPIRARALASATYAAFQYLKQQESLKGHLDERTLFHTVKMARCGKNPCEEYTVAKGIIKNVSSFLQSSKWKEVAKDMCVLFNVPKEWRDRLLKWVEKKDEEDQQQLYATEEICQKTCPKGTSWDQQIRNIVTDLMMEKKMTFLKYQVEKSLHLYKIVNQFSLRQSDEMKCDQRIITNVLLMGKKFSGRSTIVLILATLINRLEMAEQGVYNHCTVENINLRYCEEGDCLRFVFGRRGGGSSQREENNRAGQEAIQMGGATGAPLGMKNAQVCTNKLARNTKKKTGPTPTDDGMHSRNDPKERKHINQPNHWAGESMLKKNRVHISVINVRDSTFVERIISHTMKKNLLSQMEKEEDECRHRCFVFTPERLTEMSPNLIGKYHHVQVRNTVPFLPFITHAVERIKTYKSAKKKIVKVFEDLFIEAINFFRKYRKGEGSAKLKFRPRSNQKNAPFESNPGEEASDHNDKGIADHRDSGIVEHHDRGITSHGNRDGTRRGSIEEGLRSVEDAGELEEEEKSDEECDEGDDDGTREEDGTIHFLHNGRAQVNVHINTLISHFVHFVDYFITTLKEKKGTEKKILDNHLNNIITISFVYSLTSFMDKKLRTQFEGFIFKHINNLSIIPRNTSFVHLHYNAETNKIMRHEKVFSKESLHINKMDLVDNALFINDDYFLFEDSSILCMKYLINISSYLRMPLVLMGGSNSAKSKCVCNHLNSPDQKRANLHNFTFRFNALFRYSRIVNKLRRSFDLSRGSVPYDVTIFIDDVNCLGGGSRLTMEFLYALAGSSAFFDRELATDVALPRRRIFCTFNSEQAIRTQEDCHDFEKMHRNFFVLNVGEMDTRDIHSVYSNVIEALFLKYNFCEEVITECNSFIKCILEIFEGVMGKARGEEATLCLHTSRMNNLINHLLLCDKDITNSINDILIFFKQDVYRTFCSDVISHSQVKKCRQIIEQSFTTRFSKYILQQSNEFFLSREENNLTVQVKSNLCDEQNGKINLSFVRSFFEDKNVERFYHDVVRMVLMINSFLLLRRSNVVFLNEQEELLRKIVTIYCAYKNDHAFFLANDVDVARGQLREAYHRTVKSLLREGEVINANVETESMRSANLEGSSGALHGRNLFLGRFPHSEEYLDLMDNVLHNGDLDRLYEDFTNHYYLDIVSLIKHREVLIGANMQNYIAPMLLNRNHFIFYTNRYQELHQTHSSRFVHFFKSFHVVHLDFFNFEESTIFLFNLSLPLYNYVKGRPTYRFPSEAQCGLVPSSTSDVEIPLEVRFLTRMSGSLNGLLSNQGVYHRQWDDRSPPVKPRHCRNPNHEFDAATFVKKTHQVYTTLRAKELNPLLDKRDRCKKFIDQLVGQNEETDAIMHEMEDKIRKKQDEMDVMKNHVEGSLREYKDKIHKAKNDLKRITKEDFTLFKQENRNRYGGFLKIVYLYFGERNDEEHIKSSFHYGFFIRQIKNIVIDSVTKSLILKYENVSNVDRFLNYRFVKIINAFIVSINDYVKRRDSLLVQRKGVIQFSQDVSSLRDDLRKALIDAASPDVRGLLEDLLSIDHATKEEIERRTHIVLPLKSVLFIYCSAMESREKKKFIKLLMKGREKYRRMTLDAVGEEQTGQTGETRQTGETEPPEQPYCSRPTWGDLTPRSALNLEEYLPSTFLEQYSQLDLCWDSMVMFNCHLMDVLHEKIIICIDPFQQMKKYLLKKFRRDDEKYVYVKWQCGDTTDMGSGNTGSGKSSDNTIRPDRSRERSRSNEEEHIAHITNKVRSYRSRNFNILFKKVDDTIYSLVNEGTDGSGTVYIFADSVEDIDFTKVGVDHHVILCDYKKRNLLNLFAYYYDKGARRHSQEKEEKSEGSEEGESSAAVTPTAAATPTTATDAATPTTATDAATPTAASTAAAPTERLVMLTYVAYLLTQSLGMMRERYKFPHQNFLKMVKWARHLFNSGKSKDNEACVLNFLYFHILSFVDSKHTLLLRFLLSIYLDVYHYKAIKWKDVFLFFRSYDRRWEKRVLRSIGKKRKRDAASGEGDHPVENRHESLSPGDDSVPNVASSRRSISNEGLSPIPCEKRTSQGGQHKLETEEDTWLSDVWDSSSAYESSICDEHFGLVNNELGREDDSGDCTTETGQGDGRSESLEGKTNRWGEKMAYGTNENRESQIVRCVDQSVRVLYLEKRKLRGVFCEEEEQQEWRREDGDKEAPVKNAKNDKATSGQTAKRAVNGTAIHAHHHRDSSDENESDQSDQSDPSVHHMAGEEDPSIDDYLPELLQLRRRKRCVFKKLLKHIKNNKKDWDRYVRTTSCNLIEAPGTGEGYRKEDTFPLKEFTKPSMLFYKMVIDKIIKKEELILSVRKYINVKLSGMIYLHRELVSRNLCHLVASHIEVRSVMESMKHMTSEGDSSYRGDSPCNRDANRGELFLQCVQRGDYFDTLLRERKKLIVFLQKNRHSFALSTVMLSNNSVLYIDIKNASSSVLSKQNDVVMMDVVEEEDVHKAEKYIKNTSHKIYFVYYNRMDSLSPTLIRSGVVVNLDFAQDSREYLQFLYFCLSSLRVRNAADMKELIAEENSPKGDTFRCLFFTILFFSLLNEQGPVENLNVNVDLLSEMMGTVEAFSQVAQKGNRYGEEVQLDGYHQEAADQDNLNDRAKYKAQLKKAEKCRDFLSHHLRAFVELLFPKERILTKNMMHSFVCNLFSSKMNRNSPSVISNVLQIPTNITTLHGLIEYMGRHFHLTEKIFKKNKSIHLYEGAQLITLTERVLLSECQLINRAHRRNTFQLILLYLEEFSRFVSMRQAVNATSTLKYLTEEYNSLLSHIRSMKGQVRHLAQMEGSSHLADDPLGEMQSDLLTFRVPHKWDALSMGENDLREFFGKIKKKLTYLRDVINADQRGGRHVYDVSMFSNPLLFFYSVYLSYARSMNVPVSSLNVSFKYCDGIGGSEEGIWLLPIRTYKGEFVTTSQPFAHPFIHKRNSIFMKICDEENRRGARADGREGHGKLGPEAGVRDDCATEEADTLNDATKKEIGDPTPQMDNQAGRIDNTKGGLSGQKGEVIRIHSTSDYWEYIHKKENQFYYDSPYIYVKIKKNKQSETAQSRAIGPNETSDPNRVSNQDADKGGLNKNSDAVQNGEGFERERSNLSDSYDEGEMERTSLSGNTTEELTGPFSAFKNNDPFDRNDFVFYCPVLTFNPRTRRHDKTLFFLPIPCIYSKTIYKKLKVHMLL
ncbi:hypothetical protein C922_03423 [Plasmodium inui San Antonio 1]|uniref:Dynein heavy chain C-terminal domain-containing protein n=1 Tax=Plasmodium inui San Antonio 1 TaxID=1237626 RepID=W7A4K9_9APIC|nr:hypothetical protein C922_03423 [Plasmodium inui San Antonio 1]EUD66228.1 hypothetical protein C922_03423 [Plasmodium inui San Antonio 1]